MGKLLDAALGAFQGSQQQQQMSFDPNDPQDEQAIRDSVEVSKVLVNMPEEQRALVYPKAVEFLTQKYPKLQGQLPQEVPSQEQLESLAGPKSIDAGQPDAVRQGLISPRRPQDNLAESVADEQDASINVAADNALDMEMQEEEEEEGLDIAEVKGVDKSKAGDFKVPTGYRLKDNSNPGKGIEPIPGGPADRATGENASKQAMMLVARKAAGRVSQYMFDKDGSPNYYNIFNMDIPFVPGDAGTPWSDGRHMRALMEHGIQAITRAETGAAMPKSEIENTRTRYQPSVWDSPITIRMKFEMFNEFITGQLKLLRPDGKFDVEKFEKEMLKRQSAMDDWLQRAHKLNPNMSLDQLKDAWMRKRRGN